MAPRRCQGEDAGRATASGGIIKRTGLQAAQELQRLQGLFRQTRTEQHVPRLQDPSGHAVL